MKYPQAAEEPLVALVNARITPLREQKAALLAEYDAKAAEAIHAELSGKHLEFTKVLARIVTALDEVNSKLTYYEAALRGLGAH
jgi:hypothetical protein